MKVIEQDPALAAAGSRLTCVVGVSAWVSAHEDQRPEIRR
jgi:enamine deaminase RidA (YjgF/YER057c/UK114 family)